MHYKKIYYSNHAVKQMFQRNISNSDVENILKKGEIIMTYPDDKPYPSMLLFAYQNDRPLHVVCSYNSEDETIVIITAYEPVSEIWKNDFKTRKNK